jgi:hypothetical protein
MAEASAVDRLPPEARFALRVVAAGIPIDDAGALLRLDGATVRKHLRNAARGLGGTTPPPSEGDAALLAALAPALAAGREPPSKAPAKPCPDDDVADALATFGLDGPLMLAEAEHAADCPKCLARLVAMRKSGATAASVAAPPAARPSPWPLVVGVAVGVALALWYLFS